jgi:hypothetical protein
MSPSVSATPTGRLFPVGVVAIYESQGGLAFRHTRLTVHQDGRLRLEDLAPRSKKQAADEGTASGERIEALRRLIDSPEFAALDERYVPANPCCDRIEHRLTVPGQGGARTITWLDGEAIPPVLEQAATLLRALQQQATST